MSGGKSMFEPNKRLGYESALDIPTIREMVEQLQGMKKLTWFVGRKHRAEVVRLEAQVRLYVAQIDAFYELLSDRHWIFHDQLNMEKVGDLILLDGAAAEESLIDQYRDPESLRFMMMGLNGLDAMVPRMELVRKAQEDYEAGRYYAVVLVLLAVMDGFVNDVETAQRKGLHAREPEEMAAWDSVVGHHRGLAHAHSNFTRSSRKTSGGPLYDLERHGIVHGMLVNFDNVVVATKAWNRLFAVADWARSLEKQKADSEPKPQTSWRELFKQIVHNEETKRAIAAWHPSVVRAADDGFDADEVVLRTKALFDAWRASNYGAIAGFLSPRVAEDTVAKTAGAVREQYAEFELKSANVEQASYEAAAVCVIDAVLQVACFGEDEPKQRRARVRWIRETEDGSPAAPNVEGTWKLFVWGPWEIVTLDAGGA
jgi:hypothetical protein